MGLAVSDINAAGGVNGATACHNIQDSGDSTDMSVSSASGRHPGRRQAVGRHRCRVLVSVSLNVVDTFADNKITEVSPANTAVDLSGYSPWYFRTAPPDTVQGNALGTLISSDGYQKIAFLVFNDTYGTGLRNVIQETIEAAGGECVYGCKGDGDEFPAGQTTFSAEVSAALRPTRTPSSILAFDETKSIVPELAAQGWDMSKTYFSDGNTVGLQQGLPKGTLEGAQGTIPGADPAQGFKDRVQRLVPRSAQGKALTDYLYAAESYDATILAALAAVKGGSTDSATDPEELRGGLRRHRRRGVQHLRRLRRSARRRQRRSSTPVLRASVRSTTRTTRRRRSSASTPSTPTTSRAHQHGGGQPAVIHG